MRSCSFLPIFAAIFGAFGCADDNPLPASGGGAGGAGSSSVGGMAMAGTTTGGAGSGGEPAVPSAGGGGSAGGQAGTSGGGTGTFTAGAAGAAGAAGSVAVIDPGTDGDGPVEVGPTYPNGPVADLTDRGKPRGKSFNFTMSSSDSKFYKGDDSTLNAGNRHSFTRRIDVYVPAAYKDGTAAPFLVIHDGPAQIGLVSRALDNLTVSTDPARRLPAFVAIAVANGGGDGKGSERGLEYDTMSDRFVRFINEEVLPAVENKAEIRAAYPGFKLTTEPEGRATLGCSSGGAAALTMGWFRPDLFHRLITYSGTFVDQQDDDAAEEKMYPLGAWEYHSSMKLIENAEKKPLRIFLHHSDGDNGAGQPESGHHNWVMANDRTADALKAKGYHYRHLTALDAGHCAGKVFDATLADTLVWAWRGYPLE
jgi:iron(III)-enterobactin esterase